MDPLVGADEGWNKDGVAECRAVLCVLRVEVETKIRLAGLIEQAHGLPGCAKLKYPGVTLQPFPLDPNLHGALRQILEYIGRQFDATAIPIQLQRLVLRRRTTVHEQHQKKNRERDRFSRP